MIRPHWSSVRREIGGCNHGWTLRIDEEVSRGSVEWHRITADVCPQAGKPLAMSVRKKNKRGSRPCGEYILMKRDGKVVDHESVKVR